MNMLALYILVFVFFVIIPLASYQLITKFSSSGKKYSEAKKANKISREIVNLYTPEDDESIDELIEYWKKNPTHYKI